MNNHCIYALVILTIWLDKFLHREREGNYVTWATVQQVAVALSVYSSGQLPKAGHCTPYACINVYPEGGGADPQYSDRDFCCQKSSPGHYFFVRIPWVNLGGNYFWHVFSICQTSPPWSGARVLCQNYGGGTGILCQNPGGSSSSPLQVDIDRCLTFPGEKWQGSRYFLCLDFGTFLCLENMCGTLLCRIFW